MADAECGYSGGSLAGAIVGTFFATLVLLGIIYLVWEWQKKRRMKRSGLHNLVIVEDGGGTGGGGDGKAFSYDNPGFIDDSTDGKKSHQGGGLDAKFSNSGKPASQQNGGKKMPWGPLSFLFKSRNALDDSVVEEPQKYNVALRGHDFTGLGFNICGNMRDGIFVKDIMQRGPAAESKEILPGDQITGMTVSFKQMVLEDALTLLSYASPYEVNLEMLRLPEKSLPHKGIFVSSPAHPSTASAGQSNTLERVCHPFFKSQSIDDLRKVGKEHLDLQVDRKKKQANGIHAKTSATSGTMEIPTVVVVANNENRSSSSSSKTTSAVKLPKLPKLNFSLGSSSPKTSKAPEAHQKSSSSAQIQIPIPDEVDGAKGPIVSLTKPEVIPRTKAKSSHVQKSATEDMELVEAISPAIDKMTAEFEKSKKELKEVVDKAEASASSSASAVLDVQPIQVDMSGQPSVIVETEGSTPTGEASISGGNKIKVELPSAAVDVRAPSMIAMSGGGKSSKEKEPKKKDKSGDKSKSKQKGSALDIDLTPPQLSLNSGIELAEGETGSKEDSAAVKKPQRGQKSKDKTDKPKDKVLKPDEEVKESSDQNKQGESSATQAGEKSKFFKFGIPVLPDISLNFGFGGSKSASTDEKEKDSEKDKEKDTKDKLEKDIKEKSEKEAKNKPEKGIKEKSEKEAKIKPEKATKNKSEKNSKGKSDKEFKVSLPVIETSIEASVPKVETSIDVVPEAKEKSLQMPNASLQQLKDEKKGKEVKDKSPKSKNKKKEEKSLKNEQSESEDQQQAEKSQKEKSSSSFSFNIKLPSFDKPLLKRKDSSGSSSGEIGAEPSVDSRPDASTTPGKDSEKLEKVPAEASPSKFKKKTEKEKKGGSRPTSPEVSEGHRTTDDEADKNGDLVDSLPGEKVSKKGGGFHMPHIGIKLPKFGHSKQTYSFENAGDNKDLKHGHGPTAESLLESPSMKVEMAGNTAEFRKMTPTPEIPEVKVEQSQGTIKVELPQVEAPEIVKKTMDEIDSNEVKVEIEAPVVTLPSFAVELPSTGLKAEASEINSSPAPAAEKIPNEKFDVTKVDSPPEDETTKKDEISKEKETPKEKESKPSFVSKGLKGLRDLKDKVAHKLSHDHQQHASSSSSEDEGGPDAEGKEKLKKEKKTKESRDKSKEEKAREKEEKAKEKERLKAEKKIKKAELKKKLSSAHSSSSSSSSSSSDESDADDGTNVDGKIGKKEKKKLKTKESKSSKEKKAKKEKKNEKSDKKSALPSFSGIEVATELPTVELQSPEITASTAIEQKQLSGHEAKLIPAKPPVVPRKSKDSLKDEPGTAGAESAEGVGTKTKLKKSKSKGGNSTSSSSSSSDSESDDNKKDDKEGKPKKPKRVGKRKAPEIPTLPGKSATVDVPDLVKITTSAEISTPPRKETKSENKNGEMRESTPSKTPESGRRSASFGDLSSLQSKPKSADGPLERAMSMDMAGDKEHCAEPGSMPVGSSHEDLSAVPDSKAINHLSRSQQNQGLRDSIASKSSSSSSETLKASPTSVVQVHPKEMQQKEIEVVKMVETTSPNTIAEPQSSTIQQMMNETLSVMTNIVHEMDSPSLVKAAMSNQTMKTPTHVTISTTGNTAVDKSEAEKVARETVEEIMVKASQTLASELQVTTATTDQTKTNEPKVSVTTGNSNGTVNLLPDIIDMEGGADSFSIASVKIQGTDGDGGDEPISVRNITVTNIKNVPKVAADANVSVGTPSSAGAESEGQNVSSTTIVSTTDPSGAPHSGQLMRENSKARLLQTVADANDIKVAPATPLRKDSSLSSSSCSVDSSPEVKSESTKPVFVIDAPTTSSSALQGKSNGQTIEITSEELDGIMMSHADFLQKQAAASTQSGLEDSLENPDQRQQLKDVFDNWVYVEQKNAAHEHTCPHSHSDPEPSTASSNDDDDGPYSRNGALSPTTYRMETEYKFETSEMRVTSSPIPPEEAHVKSQSTVYSTTMTLPQKTVTQITLGDPAVMDAGGRIVSKITLDTSSQGGEDANKGSTPSNVELPKLESLK